MSLVVHSVVGVDGLLGPGACGSHGNDPLVLQIRHEWSLLYHSRCVLEHSVLIAKHVPSANVLKNLCFFKCVS